MFFFGELQRTRRNVETCNELLMLMFAECVDGVGDHDHHMDGTRYGERCSCCPYGYHIDLDFLRYLDSLYSGESLKSLRRIRPSRTGELTVSTSDVFFSDDELSRWRLMSPTSPVQSPPPRSASSSSRVTTDEILMEIDSSMTRTYHTMDNEVDTRVVRKKKPPRPLPPESRPRENGYRSPPEERRIQRPQESKTFNEVANTTTVTSAEIADKFTGLMSGTQSPVVGEQPNVLTPGSISPEILQAIREQMAVSLQRMRDLEDQVRVMPVMEDQISSLRNENKRLYHLLSRLTEDKQARGMFVVNGDTGLHVEGDENIRTYRGEEGSILVELPVKVGKEKVVDRSSYSMHSTETRTEVRKTNAAARRSFFWGTSEGENAAGVSPESLRLFRPSRTIGVGDGNVFETGSLVDWPAWRKTRDVGVHCLPPSRDVSVSVSEATAEEPQEDVASGGARVSLTVSVSDERRVCEPRWEVERFGSGLYQDVAVQCLVIGGFLTSDRSHMSENVDGWLVEANKLWTYSADNELVPQSAATRTRLEYQPEAEPSRRSADYVSPEERSLSAVNGEQTSSTLDALLKKLHETQRGTRVDDTFRKEEKVSAHAKPSSSVVNDSFKQETSEDGYVPEQSMSAVKIERQSAGLDEVFSKLYQTQRDIGVDDAVKEKTTVSSRAKPSSFDLSDSFKKMQATLDHALPEDGCIEEQSVSAVKMERQSASLDGVFSKLYQTQSETGVDDNVKEEETVPARVKPSAFDLNASFKKMQETTEEQDVMVKEDVIVAQSKPRAVSSCTVGPACDYRFDEMQEQTVEEGIIVAQSAAPKASSQYVKNLPMEDLVDKQECLVSRLNMEDVTETVRTSTDHEDKESSVDSAEVQPFPPHLSRITASSVSDDDALSDQQQHDTAVLETSAVTVVEAASSSPDALTTSEATVDQKVQDQTMTTQTSVSEGGMVVTKKEVTREVTKVITESEVTSEVTVSSSVETVSTSNATSGSAEHQDVLSPDLIDINRAASAVINAVISEVQRQQQTSEVTKTTPDVSTGDGLPQPIQSAVLTAQVGDVQQLPGEVVPATTADTAADQSQGCHIIITETCIERQLIGCDSDQSQPVVIVPEDTIIQ